MMIPQKIRLAMSNQQGRVDRPEIEFTVVDDCLKQLGVEGHGEFSKVFRTYNFSGVLSNQQPELLDLCSPSCQIAEATEFGRDTYEITDDFICLTSGEGEGFLLYSKSDRKVYDVAVSELDALEAGEIEARWESFFQFLEWYLS